MTATLSAITEAIGWTLVHFLWQGVAITLALVIFSAIFKRSRYGLATIAMASMLVCAIVTFAISLKLPAPVSLASVAAQPVDQIGTPPTVISTTAPKATLSPATTNSPSQTIAEQRPNWLSAVVTLWLIGVVLFSLRLVFNWCRVCKLRRDASPISDHSINAKFTQIQSLLSIKASVQLLSSAEALVPMVIGAIKPAIILPARLLSGFNTQQLEAIVAHELAHVRRHDYLVNLLQNLLEALFFYHPAVWLVSRKMREEREHCCDDIAAQLSGGPLVYGRALAALEQELGSSPPIAGVAANGGSLLNRIRRLAGTAEPERSAWPAILLCSSTAALVALSLLMNATAQDDPIEPEDEGDGFPKELPVAVLPEKLKNVVSWGKENESGLSAAISLQPRKKSYPEKSTVEREFLVANFGSKQAKFTVGHWLQDDAIGTKAVDEKGETIEVSMITDSGVTMLIDVTLNPGQFVRIPAPQVFLNPIPVAKEVSPSGAYVHAETGSTVRLSAKVEIEKIGKLPTGILEFKIAKPKKEKLQPKSIRVSGTVVDDSTGKPVTGFTIQAGKMDPGEPGEIVWGFSETRGGHDDGKFTTNVRWHQGWTARILADGYEPMPILTKTPANGADKTEIELRLKPGRVVRGQVLDHNGKPLAGASVFRVGSTALDLRGGHAWTSYGDDEIDKNVKPAITDADGKFALGVGGASKFAVSDESLDAWPAELPKNPEDELIIRLPKPASLTIEYDIEGAPEEDEIFFQTLLHLDDRWKKLEVMGSRPIKNGSKLTLKGMVPGSYQIARNKMVMLDGMGTSAFVNRSFLTFKPGEHKVLSFVRKTGTRITGKVVVPKGVDLYGTVIRVQSLEKSKNPIDGDDYRYDLAAIAAKEDGSYQTERIPPGKYKVIAEGYEKPDPDDRFGGGRMGPSYSAEFEIEIPEVGDRTEAEPLVLKP